MLNLKNNKKTNITIPMQNQRKTDEDSKIDKIHLINISG